MKILSRYRPTVAAMVMTISVVLSAGAASTDLTGKVLQVLSAGRYTYVEVEGDGQSAWAAAPAFDVRVGDTVKFGLDMPMRAFVSKALKRTFELVYFVGKIEVNGQAESVAQMPAGHPVVGKKDDAPLPELDLSGIARPEGSLAVAEVFERRNELSGKSVTVHGRVLKATPRIMGKRWLHLGDGTGGKGSNDLTITTQDIAKRGDLVTATGTAVADKDFGFGYYFAVLIEDAKVTVDKDPAVPQPAP